MYLCMYILIHTLYILYQAVFVSATEPTVFGSAAETLAAPAARTLCEAPSPWRRGEGTCGSKQGWCDCGRKPVRRCKRPTRVRDLHVYKI